MINGNSNIVEFGKESVYGTAIAPTVRVAVTSANFKPVYNKKSVRHWLINEIGGNRYEGVHLHGLIWGDSDEIKKRWRYGFVFIGDKVNEGTINYISKYVTKIDKKHSEFISKVFCSKGIGNGFLINFNASAQAKKVLPVPG